MTPENKQLLQAIIECAKKAKQSEVLRSNFTVVDGRAYGGVTGIEYIDANLFIQELEKLLIQN